MTSRSSTSPYTAKELQDMLDLVVKLRSECYLKVAILFYANVRHQSLHNTCSMELTLCVSNPLSFSYQCAILK
jgi:hypothetical protein